MSTDQSRLAAAAGPPRVAVRLITSAELSEIINVPLRTIEDWRRRGSGPPWVRIGPRAVRYDPVELTLWLERNRPSRVPA